MIDATSFFLGAVRDNLILEPGGFWVVLAALGFLCWRFRKLPWPALVPVFMFMALYCANEAWNLVETPPKVGWHDAEGELQPFDPQKDLALGAALKAAQEQIIPAAARQGVQNAERLRVAVIYPENMEALQKAREAYQAGTFFTAVNYITAAVVIAVVALRMFGPNFAAFTLMLVVLGGAEWYTFLVNWLGCEVILDDTSEVALATTWSQTASKAVCSRETSGWFEALGMLVFVGLMWWILDRYANVLRFGKPASN